MDPHSEICIDLRNEIVEKKKFKVLKKKINPITKAALILLLVTFIFLLFCLLLGVIDWTIRKFKIGFEEF